MVVGRGGVKQVRTEAKRNTGRRPAPRPLPYGRAPQQMQSLHLTGASGEALSCRHKFRHRSPLLENWDQDPHTTRPYYSRPSYPRQGRGRHGGGTGKSPWYGIGLCPKPQVKKSGPFNFSWLRKYLRFSSSISNADKMDIDAPLHTSSTASRPTALAVGLLGSPSPLLQNGANPS